MCFNPKWIYKKGRLKEPNYNSVLNNSDLYEIGTYSKCGHCQQCINEKNNNWIVRNAYEGKRWGDKKISFITLTYEKNPIILNKTDMQKFWKRLRRNLEMQGFTEKIRYFQSSQYGTLNNRPHHHAIIYNWTDENAEYLTINKKGNILYQSKLIQKTWGLGRTSIQTFNAKEIPYTTLYETPKETFKRAYILSRKKVKEIENIYHRIDIDDERRKELIKNLNSLRDELEREKKKYLSIKEFNTWSIALGWEAFYEEFLKNTENYAFEEYFLENSYCTPSPWVKKLANMGFTSAIQEMGKRQEMIEQSASEEEERTKNLLRYEARKKRELMEWQDKKTRLEEF